MTANDALAESSRLYGEIYRIRQGYFRATHIGLGTWGRYEALGEHDQERIQTLQRERNRYRADEGARTRRNGRTT